MGLIIKVIYTRNFGIEGITLLSLIAPTYSLLISIANFNILVSISKRISSGNSTKKVIVNACYIMFFLNLVVITIGLFLSRFISVNLLKNTKTYYPLIACLFTLPFISIGYIIKGYFYGRQNTLPHMVSNVIEQLFKLLLVSVLLPKIVRYGPVIAVTVYILFNILSESISICVFLFFLPKNKNISKDDLRLDFHEAKEILNISVPSISGRLLGNIGFFLEPILFTGVLTYMGLSLKYITTQYAVYNSYAISTLLFPSFFISAISNALLPEISYNYERKNSSLLKRRIRQSLFISFVVGAVCCLCVFLFKESILNILYDTSEGMEYICILAPFFVLFYLEGPLATMLVGMDKVKECTIVSVSGVILKLIVMVILGFLNFKIYALIFAEIFNIIYVTLFDFIVLKKQVSKLV